MHNGYIDGFHAMKRDLALAVDPDRFADMEGTTDSEMLLFLAMTFGLEQDPPDGATTWVFRYSSEGRSRSLFHSTDVSTLRQQYPDIPEFHRLSDDARLVVSEPVRDLRGAWREVPEASCVEIRGGEEIVSRFKPLLPAGIA